MFTFVNTTTNNNNNNNDNQRDHAGFKYCDHLRGVHNSQFPEGFMVPYTCIICLVIKKNMLLNTEQDVQDRQMGELLLLSRSLYACVFEICLN
jgi:hypothetical protein